MLENFHSPYLCFFFQCAVFCTLFSSFLLLHASGFKRAPEAAAGSKQAPADAGSIKAQVEPRAGSSGHTFSRVLEVGRRWRGRLLVVDGRRSSRVLEVGGRWRGRLLLVDGRWWSRVLVVDGCRWRRVLGVRGRVVQRHGRLTALKSGAHHGVLRTLSG